MDFKCNIVPSPLDIRDYVADSIFPVTATPNVLDLRPELQTVRNQGQQGSCAAQTAACCKEYQEKKDIGLNQYMSPQFVYNLRVNKDIEGMYGRDVMKILKTKGICREVDFSYGETTTEIPEDVLKIAENFKIQGYGRVYTQDALKKALYRNGPCYISFPCYNNGPKFWRKGIYDTSLGGHAVTVVGYTKDAFILRNSWGKNWGDKGYCYYPFTDWGTHWEIWTTIDDKSHKIEPKNEPKLPFPCCTIS